MKLETHQNLGRPKSFEATRLVARDDFGNPVAVLMESVPGQVWVYHRGQPNFEQVLKNLGIQDTIFEVHTMDHGALPTPPGKLWTPGDGPLS